MGLIDRIADDARRAAERERRRPWRDKFPAVLTAVDSTYSPPRYAWSEQTYDANGARMVKTGGRFGTATSSPAYAYGDGQVLAPADLPMPVTLRRRLTVRGLGAVYEFPLYCGCVAGGGSGGGSALVPCCPRPIPSVLHGVFSAPGCVCLDGLSVTFIYDGTNTNRPWVAALPAETCSTEGNFIGLFDAFLICMFSEPLGYHWTLSFTGALGHTGPPSATAKTCLFRVLTTGSGACSPFYMQFTGDLITFLGAAGCECEGKTWTITITE